MNREREALDRYITGNYGEDQFKGEDGAIEILAGLTKAIQNWRESGTPDLAAMTHWHGRATTFLKSLNGDWPEEPEHGD